MILIADGGSTLTRWRIISLTEIISCESGSINPYFTSQEEIISVLKNLDLRSKREAITDVYYYGAGITGGTEQKRLEHAFQKFFSTGRSWFFDDLTAAGRAFFSKNTGIACILGTGSNSGLFSEGHLKYKIPALGYILGDEGSGADLGKRFLNAFFKRKFSFSLRKHFLNENTIQEKAVLKKIYREEKPNQYLASYAPMIKRNLYHPEIQELVLDSFRTFTERNIVSYHNYRKYPLKFAGSIAFHFQDQLAMVLKEYELKYEKAVISPVDDLVDYHRMLLK